MRRGIRLVIALVVSSASAWGCRNEAAPGSSAAATPSSSATVSGLPDVLAPPVSSASERASPLSSITATVPRAERARAVELCCKMFDPYATGCVRPQGTCPHRMKDHCEQAWKRGATLADVEPGLRRLAPLEGYFVPKQCMASAQPAVSATAPSAAEN